MIQIEEHKTLKVVGDTSLFITFDYNEDIVSTIKRYAGSHYFKKNKIWEVPLYYFSSIIDELVEYDDISLTLENGVHEDISTTSIQDTFKTQPYDYQLDGINYGLNHPRWLLLDDPGLGKTLQIIYLAQMLKKYKDVQHCLIICGLNTLKSNWKREIEKHSDLSCAILGEYTTRNGNTKVKGIPGRVDQLKSTIDSFFIITNIESLRDNDIVDLINNGPNAFDMIVVDEVHVCKSPKSLQSKNLLKLNKATYKIGATGTLLLNNPLDSFVPLKFIEKERSTYTNFKNFYCNYDGAFSGNIVSYKNMNHLKEQIHECSLRRKKDLLKLPPKIVIPEILDMNNEQSKLYEDIKNGIKDDIDKVTLDTTNLLGAIVRLRQATACPTILTSNNIESVKINRAVDLAEQVVSNGEKVVIFSTFKETAYQIVDSLKTYNPLLCTGDTPEAEISRNIDEFQNDTAKKIMVATWQKMGTGITLNSANYMIFIDTPWTEGAFVQACDRIYRIGTNKSVTIYNLIAKDTIDERVYELIQEKSAMSNYIVDNNLPPSAIDKLKKYLQDL